MNKWKSGSFLLILVVGLTTAETVTNSQDPAGNHQKQSLQGDSGKVDYETALRPAVLQKRSIANIARLLLGGGNAPSNHPLVKYPEPKTWNLASNIVAALPAASASLAAAASSHGDTWNRRPSAIESVQQIFETKAKLIPYTGQVATGLTGLASVKGDLLRQIHTISTQAIAQTAAEAAARALAGAAAAHAVTNSIAHTVNPGADTGIKGGWTSYQNVYSNGLGRPPIDQPGPPYQSLSSAHINHYQTPSQYNSNPYAISATTPPPQVSPTLHSPVSYQPAAQSQYQNQNQNNGYYTLYNTQPSSTAHVQSPYTPAPPLAYARPTFSPNTLIATAPSVPAGNFGRSFAQPSPASSVLSTISSLLSASTAAYNAAFPGNIPAEQSSSLYSSLPMAPSPNPSSSIFRHHAGPIAAPSDVSTGIRSPGHYNGGTHRGSVNPLSQGSGNYGSSAGSLNSNSLRHNAPISNPGYAPQTNAPVFNPPSYSLNQHATSHAGQNYAQPGANTYSAQSVQTPQFGGIGSAPGNAGVGSGNYATVGGGVGSGYQGYNGGAGHGTGFVGRWDSQHAGSASSAAAPSWPATQNHYTPPGYARQATGNTNNPSGGFGGAPAQFSVAASPAFAQQTYSAAAANAYQSSAANGYAQAQQPASPPYFGAAPLNTGYQRSSNVNSNSVGGGRNTNLNYQYDSQDLYQSASTMGRGNNDDYNYQQAQRRNRRPSNSNNNNNSRTRYPSSLKKRPSSKRPQNSYKSEGSSVNSYGGSGNVRKGESGKRVIPTGNKKGSEFDSSVVVVDDDHDEYYNEGDQYNYSDEYRNHKTDPDDNENRWRSKNPSGQRPNSFHNNNSNGRWHGKVGPAKQTHTKNVRGHVKGSERARPQFGGGKGSGNIRNKKITHREKEQDKKRHRQEPNESSKSVSSQPKRERQPAYLSRDVYTTLPEYVFRVDERPDVFLRPIGRWKYRGKFGGKGFIKPRIGQADGPSGDKFGENSGESDEDLEAAYDSSRFLIESAPRRRAEEVLDSSNRGVDGSSRMDDILADSEFPISVELDPEEREASVDEVYADYNHRRHDYSDSVEDNKETEGDEEK